MCWQCSKRSAEKYTDNNQEMFVMKHRKFFVYLLFTVLAVITGQLLLGCYAQAKDKPAEPAIRLIARGDDMGCCHAANIACIKSYREGIMTSVEVMVPPPWFEEAAKMLRENPGLDVGIHLTLNSEWEGYKWGPVLGKSEVPSLVNKDGFFYSQRSLRKGFPPGMSFTEADPKIEEVEKELRAQIELALKKIPQVSHLSNHMGTSTCTPELRALVEKLSKEYNLPYRVPGLKRVGAWGGQVIPNKEAAFIEILENLTPGTYIFVLHPGFDVPEMRALWHIGYRNIGARRGADTAVFTSQKVKDVIKKRKIKLISYTDFKKNRL